MASDTERLDWLEEAKREGWEVDDWPDKYVLWPPDADRSSVAAPTLREAIDKAMEVKDG